MFNILGTEYLAYIIEEIELKVIFISSKNLPLHNAVAPCTYL
jgi:hypothetical protein